MVSVKCPHCGKVYKVGEAKLGKSAKCSCGNKFVITLEDEGPIPEGQDDLSELARSVTGERQETPLRDGPSPASYAPTQASPTKANPAAKKDEYKPVRCPQCGKAHILWASGQEVSVNCDCGQIFTTTVTTTASYKRARYGCLGCLGAIVVLVFAVWLCSSTQSTGPGDDRYGSTEAMKKDFNRVYSAPGLLPDGGHLWCCVCVKGDTAVVYLNDVTRFASIYGWYKLTKPNLVTAWEVDRVEDCDVSFDGKTVTVQFTYPFLERLSTVKGKYTLNEKDRK